MPSKPFTLKNFNWGPGLFIIGYHVALLIGLPIYFAKQTPSWSLVGITVFLMFSTLIGITAGYHRLFAHKAYEASPIARWALLLLGTLAIQGSVFEWSADHRRHHAKVDTDDDPYAITKGFWFAHILWMFQKKDPIDMRSISDLAKDPVLRFQHKYFALLSFGGNAVVALLLGWALNEWVGALVIGWWARILVSHHLTWFINSLAHFWGEKTYSREHSAVDNFVIAFLTVGEGYHNYHHTFASDYRNGVRWYHFDPGKWTIWSLARLGLARNLKRYDAVQIQRRLLLEDRRILLEELAASVRDRRDALEARVTALAESISGKLQRVNDLKRELKEMKKRANASSRKELRNALRELKRSLKEDRRRWRDLCDSILAQPLPA